MNFRVFLAILLCRVLRLAANLLHRGGTAMPGRWALKVCPDLLSIVAKDVKSVAVTGTNGKTTTTHMLEEAFEKAGYDYFFDHSGANLLIGIATTFILNATLTGKPKKKYAIVECDEAASKKVFPQIRPQVVVVTNLFRDQLDRFGEVTYTLDSIRQAIKTVPDTILCLNADCSLTASLADGLPNKVIYYGIDNNPACSLVKPEISDATHCIRCGTEYEYDYISYGHLGGFRCPKCGYKRHAADFSVREIVEQSIDSSTVVMNIQGKNSIVSVNLPALYNMYNAAGALAAAVMMGIDTEVASSALSSFKCGFGRMEQFDLGRCSAKLMLVKNPAGCNQILDFLQNIKEKFVLVICLNDHTGDGRDISWIWDVDFEKLTEIAGRLDKVIVSGERTGDMLVRIKYAGISDDHIMVEPDYGKVIDLISGQDKPVFAIPTYTAMMDLRSAIVKRFGGAEFWE